MSVLARHETLEGRLSAQALLRRMTYAIGSVGPIGWSAQPAHGILQPGFCRDRCRGYRRRGLDSTIDSTRMS